VSAKHPQNSAPLPSLVVVTGPPGSGKSGAADRHPVHWDAEAASEVAVRAAAAEWPPLSLAGELIEIDTTAWPDLDELTARVASRLGTGSR
jgi:hypothetical protein